MSERERELAQAVQDGMADARPILDAYERRVWLAGYAAAREQAAKVADDQVKFCGALGADCSNATEALWYGRKQYASRIRDAIRSMTPEKPHE